MISNKLLKLIIKEMGTSKFQSSVVIIDDRHVVSYQISVKLHLKKKVSKK